MPWVIAIMMFLTVLAAAAGLGLAGAAARLDDQIGSRVTIQIVEANPAAARAAGPGGRRRGSGRCPACVAVRRVAARGDRSELLEPWLGAGGLEGDLPVPALIDVDLDAEARAGSSALRAAVARGRACGAGRRQRPVAGAARQADRRAAMARRRPRRC